MSQYHSPDGADGCCITSNKSLACLQLVFTSNWSNFRHAFALRGFVSVSWAYLFVLLQTFSQMPPTSLSGVTCTFWCKLSTRMCATLLAVSASGIRHHNSGRQNITVSVAEYHQRITDKKSSCNTFKS